ncbi:uncharacterized protein MONOS_15236 [Monocercomonoides exilis]|uniref:uncharacterized protein n=1 Tax=Monocercomonoides exilis TaxID=2049356 RepID=UPI00355959F2|nr:hypothetical protein MONOS_15236 [Monocercomonoides exilis]|eukprot:MONOS_15236.1-p1 / transcript=MONOS_15236.1 / gene=MONOS_15236 / organism=Monocercomonoides_exilis_PA203 / gene_product=unspecified product / transcript_product=unspecified product / location=Mono_scaffold01175:3550-3849(-) / protein_length=100 / sequence_SO=supercontig / SO=protein_coding / is_pseudo=false
MVTNFARLSPTAHTPTDSFFKTNTAQVMAQVLTVHQPFPQTGSQIQPWSAQISLGSASANIQTLSQSAIDISPVQHNIIVPTQQQSQIFNLQPSFQYLQ